MDVGYKLKYENPKKHAGLLKKLFFGWMLSLVQKGTKKRLEISDLYKPLDKDKSKNLGDQLERNWKYEILRSISTHSQPSLFRVIVETFYFEFMIYGIVWFFLNVILRCAQPLILAGLISSFSGKTDETKQMDMYIYSVLLVGVTTVMVFAMNHLQFGLSAIGMRIRIACSSLVYRKITRLSYKSLGQTATGQVINLLSNDVNRFDLVVLPLHSLWCMPFQVGVLSYIIWRQVGVASLAGIFSMAIISLPVQGYLAKLMGSLRANISKKTDSRVKLMSEVISGIQVIKMYAWEKPFEKIIKIARKREIRYVTNTSYLRGIFSSCMVFLERSSLCFTVICYVCMGNNITAEKVFSLAQAYNILQLTMAIWYPMAISHGAESLISIKRLLTFLMLEEKEESNIEEISKPGVIFSNVNASWNLESDTLLNITLRIPPGTLCAVIGPVGAGKSSLLQLLLGELPTRTGKIQIGGEISYSSQEPWLFQSTVRNNILFGKSYDKSWYGKIVKVCALEKDFQQFPHGDKTVVGDRGVSLSGGQRARINLARAIYRQADIYLLDDPLSAVDTQVGKHLFEQCIVKHLRGKTRILVTHQLQYLKKANLIVVLNEGQIEAIGTFEELCCSKLDFTKIIADTAGTSDKHEDNVETDFATNNPSPRKTSLTYFPKGDLSESIEFLQDQTIAEEESGNNPNSKPLKEYLLATKHIGVLVFLILLLIVAQSISAGVDLWVAFWTSQEEIRHSNDSIIMETSSMQETNSNTFYVYKQQASNSDTNNYSFFDNFFDTVTINNEVYTLIKTNYAMYFYGCLIGGSIVLVLCRSFLFIKVCMLASVNIHTEMFGTLLKAPMRFFDTNPSGRILNRFAKDMGSIDEVLPRVLLDSVQILLILIGILVNVSISNPYTIIAMFILGIVFLKLRYWYILTAKVLKHLEGITKSPVFSHVNSSLNGIITVRASKAEGILIDEFDEHQNVHTSAWYLTISCISAFGLWLDITCVVFMASITFSFVILHKFFDVNGSLVGLAISQSMVLMGMLQFGMRQTAEVINQLTGVERVLQYTRINTEGPFDTPREKLPNEPWPRKGRIEYKNIYLKYAEDDPPVLRNLNFTILPGQKVGVVGRTGAGKSSLIAALFRLTDFKGSIFIDGVDTKTLGLTYFRRKISIIPQEPVLFSATLRYNLDPFEEFDDELIWRALEQVELKEFADSLDFMVSEGGGNFSLGQRQLVCLARAILRNNKILVLDEATANVDHRTDSLIQATIRERFKDCTVITIAHRLNTIMDSDKIIVMSGGKMVEFGHPHQLLQIPDSRLHRMVLETGPIMSEQLKHVAQMAYTGTEENAVFNFFNGI